MILELSMESGSGAWIVDGREDCRNLAAQGRAPFRGRDPDDIPVDSKLGVDEDVAEGDDLRPWDFRVGSADILGKTRGGLTDDGEFLHYSATQEFGIEKLLGVRRGDAR